MDEELLNEEETETNPTPVDPLLTAAKMALRITTNAYDSEITNLLDASKLDLGIAGVIVPDTMTAIVQQACITYVKMHFGQPDDYDRLKRSYDEQKAQLATCTGYTNWGGVSNG